MPKLDVILPNILHLKQLPISRTKTIWRLLLSEMSTPNISKKFQESENYSEILNVKFLELTPLKSGRPLLLGNELDSKVQTLLNEFRSKEGNINTSTRIVKALAKGAVLSQDRTLLRENGGGIDITRDWVLSIMKRMHSVKRRGI